MSKKTRPIQEINNSYFRKVAELGDLKWKLEKIPRQMEAIERELKSIDGEMEEAQAIKIKEEQTAALKAAEKAKQTQTETQPESLR